jgi:hypothetical protein
MATIFLLDGFEHGNNAGAGAGGIYDSITAGQTTPTTPVKSGLRSRRINASASQVQVRYNITAGNRIVTTTLYVRFATLPTADVQLVHFISTVNGYLWFMNTNDKFGVSVTTSGQVEGGPTLVVDTWYRVTIEFDTTTNTFQIRAIVDGGAEFSDTSASTAADITVIGLGNTTSATYEAFYDDWVISVTDGDYEEMAGWTGHGIESLIPSSDGTHNITTSGDFDSFTGTAFSNATTNGNTFIGHRPLQFANTANQVVRQELGTTANYMEFGLEDHTLSGTVRAVRAYGTHVESAASGASLGEARLLLADDTEVLTTGSLSVINSTEDPGTTVTIRKRMCIDPSGGWDNTKVDGLKARVGFGDNAPDVNFIDFMIEALYFTAAAAAPGPPIGAHTRRRNQSEASQMW